MGKHRYSRRGSGIIRKTRRLGLENLEQRHLLAADPVLDWNAIALDAIKNDSLLTTQDQAGPTRTAYAMAVVHIAMYDAVNAINRTHTPYYFHASAPKTASLDAAVATAAYATLVNLYPQQKEFFDNAYVTYLDAIPDGLAEDQGIALGNATASRVLDARDNDGSEIDDPHELVNEPGHHQYDPLHPDQGVLTPKWGKVKPFAMDDVANFIRPAPPALDSAEYAAAFEEVRLLGAADAETADRNGDGQFDRTPEQTEIGIFWAYDGAPGIGTPPRLFNQIVRTIAEQQANTVDENARLFALVNIAMADAGIASWETKYLYDFWRPIVAIRNGDADGNLDTQGEADWTPLGAPASNSGDPTGDFTPPFPAYTSGHATFGGAVFRILERFYRTDELGDIPFSFQSDEFNGVTQDARGNVRPAVTRHFNSFREAALENAISRIYLGVHWSFDATEGLAQGEAIADYVFDNMMRATQAAHDPVLDWNWIALEAVRNDHSFAKPDQVGPTNASLALGIIHAAIFDAVNAIDRSHHNYVYSGKGIEGASIDAAVAAAAHGTLVTLFPQQKADFDAALASYLDAIPDGVAKSKGFLAGRMAAERMLKERHNDGRELEMDYSLNPEIGHHRVDPLHPDQGFLSPKWGMVKPFSMESASQFRAPPPPALDSVEYADAYNQVRVLGAVDAETADRDGDGQFDRTPEQTEIGIFWGYDGTRGVGAPPRFFNEIARIVAEQQGNTVIENARLFALLNVAMADAGIASWETKYVYDLWRPIVAIREGHLDGNPLTEPEPDWAPLGAPASNSNDPNGNFTPPFPAYVSGHATFGAAAFRILELFYGTNDISFHVQSTEMNGVTRDADGSVRKPVMRHFDSFSQAAEENAWSRIYLGVHWSFDATAGLAQGKAVADYVFTHDFLPKTILQNGVLVLDVNGDGELTVADLYAQVLQIRHMQVHGQIDPEFKGFVDIDGDEMLTHHDLLMLVRGLRDKIEASYQTPANSVASNSLKGEAEPIADNDVVVLPLLTWRSEEQETESESTNSAPTTSANDPLIGFTPAHTSWAIEDQEEIANLVDAALIDLDDLETWLDHDETSFGG